MRPIEIECTQCNGKGCNDCGDVGAWLLDHCPQKFIGQDMMEAINLAAYAMRGDWPIVGGMLDQSAWFVDLVSRLESEQNRIDKEIAERLYG